MPHARKRAGRKRKRELRIKRNLANMGHGWAKRQASKE